MAVQGPCYDDSEDIWPYQGTYPSNTNSTAEDCVNACERKGWRISGSINIRGCWCGNTLPSIDHLKPNSDCNMVPFLKDKSRDYNYMCLNMKIGMCWRFNPDVWWTGQVS